MEFRTLPVYRISIDIDDEETGMTAISLVDYPAVEKDFLAFKKENKMKFNVADEAEHKITGPAIIAGKPIYRCDYFEEYYVVFDAQTIEDIVLKYSKQNLFNMVDLQHDGEMVNGITMIEYYIKNTEKGINPAGYEDVADGSLFVTYKVTDENLWNDIVNGDALNGFSIEILANLEPTNETIEEEDFDDWDDWVEQLIRALEGEDVDFDFNSDEEYLVDGDGKFWLDENGNKVKSKCSKCGGEVGVYIKGEPVFLCSECGEYYGTVKFPEDELFTIQKKKFVSENTVAEAIKDGAEVNISTKDGKEITGEIYTVGKANGKAVVAVYGTGKYGDQWYIYDLKDIDVMKRTGNAGIVDWNDAMKKPSYGAVSDLLDEITVDNIAKKNPANQVPQYKNEYVRAIMEHKYAMVTYRDASEEKCTGSRMVGVFEYGYNFQGSECIRCYQYGGSTHTEPVAWKNFRTDRILSFRVLDYMEPISVAPNGFRHIGEGEDRDGFQCEVRSDL